MNKACMFLIISISSSVFDADFPPFVEKAFDKYGCENYDGFSEINETDEYPFQYGYGDPENIVIWCKWKVDRHLLILSRKGEENVLYCPSEVKSKYILSGGLSLLNKKIKLSDFLKLSNNFPLQDEGETEGILIHSNWAGAGTYLYCHKDEWVYFNHD